MEKKKGFAEKINIHIKDVFDAGDNEIRELRKDLNRGNEMADFVNRTWDKRMKEAENNLGATGEKEKSEEEKREEEKEIGKKVLKAASRAQAGSEGYSEEQFAEAREITKKIFDENKSGYSTKELEDAKKQIEEPLREARGSVYGGYSEQQFAEAQAESKKSLEEAGSDYIKEKLADEEIIAALEKDINDDFPSERQTEKLSADEREKIEATVKKKPEVKKGVSRCTRNVLRKVLTSALAVGLATGFVTERDKAEGLVDDKKLETTPKVENVNVVNLDQTIKLRDGSELNIDDFGDAKYEYSIENDATIGGGNQYYVLKDDISGETVKEKLVDVEDKIQGSWDFATLWGSALGVGELGGTKIEDITKEADVYADVENNKFRYDVADAYRELAKDEKVTEFFPKTGTFISEYYINDGESMLASKRNVGKVKNEGGYLDYSDVFSDEQKMNICEMLGVDIEQVREKEGHYVEREECGQIGIWYDGGFDEINPEIGAEPTPETPVKPTPTPIEPTPVEPTPIEPTPIIITTPEPKNPENEQRIVNEAPLEGKVEQTQSKDIEEVTTKEPNVGMNEVPTASGDDRAQVEANKNEITEPMSDADFENFMENFLGENK